MTISIWPWRLQPAEQQHAQAGADHPTGDEHGTHLEVDALAPQVAQHAGDRGGEDLRRPGADGDRRRHAEKDQQRRQQEAATDAEQPRQEPDRTAQGEQCEQVHRDFGNGEVDIHDETAPDSRSGHRPLAWHRVKPRVTRLGRLMPCCVAQGTPTRAAAAARGRPPNGNGTPAPEHRWRWLLLGAGPRRSDVDEDDVSGIELGDAQQKDRGLACQACLQALRRNPQALGIDGHGQIGIVQHAIVIAVQRRPSGPIAENPKADPRRARSQ